MSCPPPPPPPHFLSPSPATTPCISPELGAIGCRKGNETGLEADEAYESICGRTTRGSGEGNGAGKGSRRQARWGTAGEGVGI